GRDFLVADDPVAEAQAVLSLLPDPARGTQLGLAARRRVEDRYRWSATLGGLPDLLLGAPGGADPQAA
ncbi:hypothetical protein RSW40_25530, partial [Escherichia coli]|nr:hypothetical protein [Escherichia coli]